MSCGPATPGHPGASQSLSRQKSKHLLSPIHLLFFGAFVVNSGALGHYATNKKSDREGYRGVSSPIQLAVVVKSRATRNKWNSQPGKPETRTTPCPLGVFFGMPRKEARPPAPANKPPHHCGRGWRPSPGRPGRTAHKSSGGGEGRSRMKREAVCMGLSFCSPLFGRVSKGKQDENHQSIYTYIYI